MTCAEIQELLEAYALGALHNVESKSVKDHLAGCKECSDVLAELKIVADSLSSVLAIAVGRSASPGSKAAIMARITASPANSSRLPFGLGHIRLPYSPQVLAAALALLLLSISVAWGLQQRSALARERSLRAEFAEIVSQQETVFEVVDSSRTSKSFLRAADGSTAYGKLYTRPDLPEAVVLTGRLNPLPEGQVYNLWLTSAGVERLIGPLLVSDRGFALLLFDAGQTGPSYERARVILQSSEATTPEGTLTLVWEAPR